MRNEFGTVNYFDLNIVQSAGVSFPFVYVEIRSKKEVGGKFSNGFFGLNCFLIPRRCVFDRTKL